MVGKESFGERVFDKINIIFLIILSFICLYPIYYVAVASFSDGMKLLAHSGILLKPLGFSLAAYKMVFMDPMIIKGYMNTMFVVIVGVSLNILMTSLGAYVLSRKNTFFVKPLMKMVVFTMFFSGGLIPLFLTVRELGLFNNLFALILPNVIITYNLIIMRTAFMAVPESLEESARIDGANDFTILFRVILPLSKPTVAVMVLYYGVHHWNAWFHAMIFLRERSLYPLQLILREILIANTMDQMLSSSSAADVESIGESIKYATIMVATAPILLFYPFLQKHFVKGVMIGALKG